MKAFESQVPESLRKPDGHEVHWFPAQRPVSGGDLQPQAPAFRSGMGVEEFDRGQDPGHRPRDFLFELLLPNGRAGLSA